jgi:hypothetical protein
MGKFNHFILTKFNVRTFQDSKRGCDPDWLETRFNIFQEFCYPSVHSQSNQNFKWLVFFDTNTPEIFKERISEFSVWENFVPLYLDFPLPYGEFSDAARAVVREQVTDGCEYLITTWLDNDDSICVDYVDMIQDNFTQQESETINFILGYQLCNGKAYIDFEISNHFISLIEKYNPDSFKTCLCRPHKQLYEVSHSSRQILCKPSWIEVVHGSNYMNVYRKGFRIPLEEILDDFCIKTKVVKEGGLSFWLEQAKITLFIPYYILRKVFLRLRSTQLNDLNPSYFRFEKY